MCTNCVIWDQCLHIQFLEDMCTILTCLTILDERSTRMLEDSLGSMILLKSVLVMISNLPWSLDGARPIKEGVAYWGFPDAVLFTWESPSTGGVIIFFFLINLWGLMLTSPLRGFYQTLQGNFVLQLLRELILCHGLMGESVYGTGFTWDLVDDLDS